MDIINIKFDQAEAEIGSLGMQGENKKVALHIDCSSVLEKHPGAAILVNYDPRLPGEPYFNLPVTALENGIYEAVLTPMELAYDGLKRIQVRAVEGDYEDRSKTFIAYVEKSVYDFRPPAGPVSDWLDHLRDALAKADAAQQHGPVIGTNGNWYVWQNEAYVDTGVKAEGQDGQDGYSPTLDAKEIEGGYRITIKNEESVNAFDVMNGKNATNEQVREAVNEYMKENPAAGGASVHIGPDQPTNGEMYWLDTSEDEAPEEPVVTLTGITATYTGGDVAAGTELSALTGIVVTAEYSDGSTEPVTGYSLSGTIAEGSNTITVTYEGMTATFTVTGVAEEEESTTYSVTNNLTNVTTSNSASSVEENAMYSATLTPASGYTLDGGTVTVLMGGTDVTATSYANGIVSIAAVTGNVVITAEAVEESAGGDIYTIPVELTYHDSGLQHKGYTDDGSESTLKDFVGATVYSDVFSIDTKVRIRITLTNTIYGNFSAACLAAEKSSDGVLYAYYNEKIQTEDTYAQGGKEYIKEYTVRAGHSLRLNIVESSNATALEVLREDNGVTFTKKGW